MVDLNTLVWPASDILLVDPYYINDRGYIAVRGFLPNGDQRAVVLVPSGDCDDACEGRIAAGQNRATSAQYLATRTLDSESSRNNRVDWPQDRFLHRSHASGQGVPSN